MRLSQGPIVAGRGEKLGRSETLADLGDDAAPLDVVFVVGLDLGAEAVEGAL